MDDERTRPTTAKECSARKNRGRHGDQTTALNVAWASPAGMPAEKAAQRLDQNLSHHHRRHQRDRLLSGRTFYAVPRRRHHLTDRAVHRHLRPLRLTASGFWRADLCDHRDDGGIFECLRTDRPAVPESAKKAEIAAPTQTEPPFKLTQVTVLAIFVVLTLIATIRFRKA